MEEIWKDIPGFEGLYQVSNYGRVKSLNYRRTGKEQILKYEIHPKGYSRLGLHSNNGVKYFFIHRLVAQAFIPNPDNLPQVNHKDEDKTNNRVDNLEWCSAKENMVYNDGQKRRGKINRNHPNKSKPVGQYTLDFPCKLIKVWPSTREIERALGYSTGNISQVCNGKRKYAYNYIWKYFEF